MKTYSPERKAAVIAKMLPPHNQPISQLSRLEEIPIKTLYHWRSEAEISTLPVAGDKALPREWSKEARFAVLVETTPLSAHALAEYCRRKGLYPEQLQQWKDELMQPSQREEKAEIKQLKKKTNKLTAKLPVRIKRSPKPPRCCSWEKAEGVVRLGKRGRMTRTAGRLKLMTMVQESVAVGARLSEVCRCVGLSERPLQR